MTEQPALRRIAPDDLPDLVTRLADQHATDLALIGPNIELSASPERWPQGFQGRVVYQMTKDVPKLPRQVLRLDRLKSLALGYLGLRADDALTIAEHLGQLTSLNLAGNQVGDAGARAIAEHLGQLTSLDLGDNQICEAGARAIAEHLGQLTSLYLGWNRLGEGGARVIARHLRQLTSLHIYDNNVRDAGTQAIAEQLDQLTSLNLGWNQVGDNGVAAIERHLARLVDLDLSSNKRVITVAPLANLPTLTTLNLADTGVADLSPLKSLVLGGLPVVWSQGGEGSGIYVQYCPLTHPSPEVVSQGPEAVLNFFREIEAQGVDRLFEAKLLIVGEGGEGKSSLVRRLYQPDSDLPTEDETTRGIDILRHEFPAAGGRNFRLNVWDFGGQQIYHATHQFFLTKSSLYVLVDNTRTDHTSIHDEGFKYWLEVVETLSQRSPVLIFQNEVGGRSKQIDEAGIKGRFPNVQQTLRGNLEHADAADELRHAVEYLTQRLPHVGEQVPARWVDVRRSLEELARTRPHMTQDEYFEIYGRDLELDRKKALHLSQYLHDLGVFLHFQQSRELRRTVFLQNQWVTDAVFRILDDERVRAARGRFTLADFDRLWSDRGYADMEVELRALMVRFELCYPLGDVAEPTWLAPQLLSPSKPPELNDWAAAGDLVLTYRYEFLPKGLVSRLIVRMHRFARRPDLCWAIGALFEHDETQVLVETTRRGNEIALRARGPESKELLSVIGSDLDALNASFQGFKDKVGKWVPCICENCSRSTEPAMFDQRELLERRRRNKRTIECPKPDYPDVDVLELLDGLKLDKWPEWAKKSGDDGAFAVAVSFPGEHRPFVLKVVERLAEELGRDQVFYDEWFEARLLGRGGDLKLQTIYADAELVVPFFSKHYDKPWCAMEWETIRGILLNRRSDDAVIPVHLDDTEVPGWSAVNLGIRLKDRTPEQIADLILDAYQLRHPR